MDAGRFTLHRSGWDNSAQEVYDLGCDPEPGSSGVHGGRGRYRREEGFTRYQPRYERDGYPGLSGPGKRRHLEDAQRHDKLDSFRDYGYKKHDSWEHDDRDVNDYRHRSRGDGDYESSRHHDYDSDRERSKRDRRKRDKERGGRVRDRSPDRDRWQDRSDSYGYDDVHPSRSPYGGSQEEGQYEPQHDTSADNRHAHEEEHSPLIPSATVVVKGLSQKTVEDDLYRALEGWGPLKHVRVIKEKTSGVSRGFAFIDFPSVDAAEKLMDAIGNGLIVNGRRLFFEYSRPTGGAYPDQRYTGRGLSTKFPPTIPTDWICTICGYLNFARRILCLQCNEARGEDAPAADGSVSGHRGLEPAPSHVLVVRGLDDNVDEEILHYEFSKYAPIKDLRLIRDKFTHVSRGFAFIHFNSVEDATKALEAGNGTAIDKNGQVLRVAFAKSIHGPGNGIPQATGLAAAAIEAATFAQQYDSSGWAPKEFDPKPQSNADGHDSGFVWDEASGYYYDAASGFYYDGHRGLYYDGNNGIWYTYNLELQQYEPYVETSADPVTEDIPKPVDTEPKSSKADHSNAVISAPPVHNDAIHPNAVISAAPVAAEKKPTLPEVVAAAAAAAQATTKKEKEKAKEIRLPGKAPSKKKINNALNLWKQRQSESTTASVDDQKVRGPNKISDGVGNSYAGMPFEGARQVNTAATCASGMGRGTPGRAADSGRGSEAVSTSFKTETSALGPKVGSKRRFTEAPQQVYRDRAAERRSLYGLTVPGDPMSDVQEMGPGSGRDMPFPPGVGGRCTSSQLAGPEVESYEVITPDKALDESNIGNRMLRNMGWQEGSGLGREGTGIVEPVQPQGGSERAGLGSQLQQRKLDGRFEAQPGDSYRVVIQKKALARFHEML